MVKSTVANTFDEIVDLIKIFVDLLTGDWSGALNATLRSGAEL